MKIIALIKHPSTIQSEDYVKFVKRVGQKSISVIEDYNDEITILDLDTLKKHIGKATLKEYTLATDSPILSISWYRIAHNEFKNFVYISNENVSENFRNYPEEFKVFTNNLVLCKGIEQEFLYKPFYTNINLHNYQRMYNLLLKISHYVVPFLEIINQKKFIYRNLPTKQYNISTEENFVIESDESNKTNQINFFSDFDIKNLISIKAFMSELSYIYFLLYIINNTQEDATQFLLKITSNDLGEKMDQFLTLFLQVTEQTIATPQVRLNILVNALEVSNNHNYLVEKLLVEISDNDVTPGQKLLILNHLSSKGFNKSLKVTSNFGERIRSLYKELNDYIHENTSVNWEKQKNEKRIVILNDQILSRFHAPTGVLEALTQSFVDLTDYEILLIAEENLVGSSEDYVTLTQFSGNPSKNAVSLFDELFPSPKLSVYIAPYEEGLLNRTQSILNKINEFNPKYVFSFSAHSLVQSVLVREFPLVCASHGIPYMNHPAHVYLYKNGHIAKEIDQSVTGGEKSNRIHQFFYDIKFIDKTKNYKRQDFNFTDEQFIIITSGNRINTEVDDTLIEKMASLLKNDTQIVWLLVGSTIPQTIEQKYSHFIGNQIRHISFEQDLISLSELCDISINPNRVGGGYSCLSSMKTNTPVVMTEFESDGLMYVGRENVKCKNYDDVIDEVVKMKNNRMYLNEQAEAQRKRVEMLENRTSVDVILEHFKSAEQYLAQKIYE